MLLNQFPRIEQRLSILVEEEPGADTVRRVLDPPCLIDEREHIPSFGQIRLGFTITGLTKRLEKRAGVDPLRGHPFRTGHREQRRREAIATRRDWEGISKTSHMVRASIGDGTRRPLVPSFGVLERQSATDVHRIPLVG